MKRGGLEISTREIRLLREDAQSCLDSFHIPGERFDRQPPQYHEGLELMELAKKLERYRRRAMK